MTRKPIVLENPAMNSARVQAFNKRLKLAVVIVTLFALAGVSLFFYGKYKKIEHGIESRLETISELRHAALERYLISQEQETQVWANHPTIVKAAKSLFSAWDQLDAKAKQSLRTHYFAKTKIENSIDIDANILPYVKVHNGLHDNLEKFMKHHGYYDVFLFNLQGDLVYSVVKEDDYGLKYLENTGQYSQTGLGEIFRNSLSSYNKTARTQSVSFVDFTSYPPSNGDAAAFLSHVIEDESRQVIGVYAIQIPTDAFNAKLQYSSGLGETGETFLVGQDFYMRNESRLGDEKTTLLRRIETDIVRQTLAGKSILANGYNVRGAKTLQASKPMEFMGTRWAVMTEIERKELWAPFRPYWYFYGFAILFVILFALTQFYFLRANTKKID